MVNMNMIMIRVGVVTIEWFDDEHGVDRGNGWKVMIMMVMVKMVVMITHGDN